MSKRIRLGVLTPSSNTSLEPLTSAIVAEVPGVSAHFSRFTVTEISLKDQALGQFDDTKILEAAKLLADAHVDSIGWSGTSSGWLGFERDVQLCRRITEVTGIPATTSVLALNEILAKTGTKKLGLATPYVPDVQARIVANYATLGVDIPAEQHLGISVNFDFAEVTEDTLRSMIREVAQSRPEAITTFCTNLRAAQLADELEADTGIPLYDTVSTVVWKQLRMAGIDTRTIKGWGRLFREVA
ncbi:maleate cis-trans isomerase family protein [Aromatoleum petrolei]|uniref:Asp/Glu/hydantoin racemase n=1 Tax=Aromatoleum petrolei TaxID=76116 RepID=A0ABX1MRZ7_9RHOO|nr:aspartate/glutamate racemase family protein [Aromatoleum petrolei]NMF90754.1 Asp/Glu/hydantoin racemase [Aromatoleum petrolei]QTQ38426.1 Racemase family protein [Aromatoleum petrolei]